MSERRTGFAMWVIYDHPPDYPDCYIARQWLIERGGGKDGRPTETILTAVKLDLLRGKMVAMGLTCIQPSPADHPKIVEAWF